MIGALIIDKPEGLTSHTVVARVRRAARLRRVGHAGTLDPFATGVLVVCIGRATRLMQFLVGLDKEYIATVRLGFATDTQDLTGKQITPLRSSNEVSLDQVTNALKGFIGQQSQVPPMFSAKKIAGERLYIAAREGREIERKPSDITIYDMELGSWLDCNEDGTRDFAVRVKCSSGTYIRTLAHDLGARLEVGAHLIALRRTAVGGFNLSEAFTLDEIEQGGSDGNLESINLESINLESMLMSPADTLSHLHEIRLDEHRLRLIANGREVVAEGQEFDSSHEIVRICSESGALLAVGDYDARLHTIKPRVVLAAED